MQISEAQFKKLPDHLKHLFKKLPNPGSEEVLAGFPVTHGAGTFRSGSSSGRIFSKREDVGKHMQRRALDAGGNVARFFYCAKASKRDRDEGLDGFELHAPDHGKGNAAGGLQVSNSKHPRANIHPTVKPTDLMRYLCRLVTPPNGVVLDPFAGSGSTGKAAIIEGLRFVGIERDAEYVEIAKARILKEVNHA